MKNNWEIKTGVFLFVGVLFASAAAGNVLIDSEDWKDVYTGMYITHENFDRGEPYFVTDTSASNIISGDTLPAGNVTVLESTEDAFSGGMQSRLENQPEGYNVEEVIEFQDASQDLIPEGQDKFIVVPSDYPAAAVAAGPLAQVTDSWVLFVDEDNVDQVSDIVSEASNVMLIGSFTRGIENELTQYADEKIISQSAQNISVQVAERYRQEEEFSRMMITPARELSPELFSEERPVLITKTTTPLSDTIINFVEETESIQTLFLANPEYSVVGTALNDEIEEDGERSISVMVHFGQARGDQGSIYAPNLFPLPSSNIDLNVESVVYDPAREKVLLTYRNPSDAQVFGLTESLNIVDEEGESIGAGFDEETFLLGAGSSITRTYNISVEPSQINQNLTSQITTTFGNNPETREQSLTNEDEFRPPYETGLEITEVEDSSNITLESVIYRENLGRFEASLVNNGDDPAYATVNLRNIIVRGETESLTKDIGKIESGESEKVYLTPDTPLDKVDIEENENIEVVLNYGPESNLKLSTTSTNREFQSSSGVPVVGEFSSSQTGPLMLMILVILIAAVEYRTGKVSSVFTQVRE